MTLAGENQSSCRNLSQCHVHQKSRRLSLSCGTAQLRASQQHHAQLACPKPHSGHTHTLVRCAVQAATTSKTDALTAVFVTSSVSKKNISPRTASR